MSRLIDRLEIEKLVSHYNAKDYVKCLELIKEMTDKHSIASPWLDWLRGMCETMTGDYYSGLTYLKQALASDPLNFNFLISTNEIIGDFKIVLNSALDDATSLEEIIKIHRFLVSAGEFNSTIQYLVIKNYIKHNQYESAQRVLHNYLLNNPNDLEALSLEDMLDNLTEKQAS